MLIMPIDARTFEEIKDSVRLELTAPESNALFADLTELLESVETLAQIDLSDEEPWRPLPGNAPARLDEVAPSLSVEAALALAPAAQDGYFKVPRTVDDD